MYRVIEPFYDPETKIAYEVGDNYADKAKQEHVAYLMGSSNKIGKPLIEKVGGSTFGDYGDYPANATKEE